MRLPGCFQVWNVSAEMEVIMVGRYLFSLGLVTISAAMAVGCSLPLHLPLLNGGNSTAQPQAAIALAQSKQQVAPNDYTYSSSAQTVGWCIDNLGMNNAANASLQEPVVVVSIKGTTNPNLAFRADTLTQFSPENDGQYVATLVVRAKDNRILLDQSYYGNDPNSVSFSSPSVNSLPNQ
jgi:hypothetical protein